jgi:hypothetical protein
MSYRNRTLINFPLPQCFSRKGVLFFDDLADAMHKGMIACAKWIFSNDTRQNTQALKSLT